MDLTHQIESYCQQRNISVVGKFPFDRLVVDAMVNCKSVIEFAPDSEVAKMIRESYSAITHIDSKQIHKLYIKI